MPKGIPNQNRQLGNKQTANKPKRVPVSGLRDIMTVTNQDPAFVYRWVQDTGEAGGKVLKYKRGGYDFARTDSGETHTVGDDAVYRSESNGSIIRLPTGGGQYSYLMRIPREYYEEDQAAKNEKIDALESTITGTGHPDGEDFGQYGEVKFVKPN